LFVWGEQSGLDISIDPQLHSIFFTGSEAEDIAAGDADLVFEAFVAGSRPEELDCTDEADQVLFRRALGQLGPPAHDQIYAFTTARALGGKFDLESLRVVDLFVQLDILRELAEPTIIDVS
jgi:hypothetical protein